MTEEDYEKIYKDAKALEKQKKQQTLSDSEKYAEYGNFYFIKDLSHLREMAYPLQQIKRDLHDHYNCLIEHLVKLFLYPDYTQYHSGWKASVRKGFEQIPKVKGKNTFPTQKEILSSIWENDTDTLEGHYATILKDIIYEYKDVPKRGEGKYAEFYKFAKDYIYWLSDMLSKNGGVSMDQVSNEIDDLVKNCKN